MAGDGAVLITHADPQPLQDGSSDRRRQAQRDDQRGDDHGDQPAPRSDQPAPGTRERTWPLGQYSSKNSVCKIIGGRVGCDTSAEGSRLIVEIAGSIIAHLRPGVLNARWSRD